jgi:hypothetical protein
VERERRRANERGRARLAQHGSLVDLISFVLQHSQCSEQLVRKRCRREEAGNGLSKDEDALSSTCFSSLVLSHNFPNERRAIKQCTPAQVLLQDTLQFGRSSPRHLDALLERFPPVLQRRSCLEDVDEGGFGERGGGVGWRGKDDGDFGCAKLGFEESGIGEKVAEERKEVSSVRGGEVRNTNAPVEDAESDTIRFTGERYPRSGRSLRNTLADRLQRVDVEGCLREDDCRRAE